MGNLTMEEVEPSLSAQGRDPKEVMVIAVRACLKEEQEKMV